MPERIRVAGILAIVLALIAYAYIPLLAAGFLGEDLALLAALGEADLGAGLGAWFAVDGTEGCPGAVLLLQLSRSLWASGGIWTGGEALVLRLENLLLLGLAAWGLVGALRRILEPWAGRDVARAAGHAAAGFLLVHPLAVSAVARLGAQGDLAAVALGVWALRSFLRGRQERVREAVTLSWGLAVLAGFCSPLALYLPLLLAVVEHQSARRLRPRRERLRSTMTTLVAFTAAVLVEALPRAVFAPAGQRALAAVPQAASPELWLERLGVLLMPGNVHGFGSIAPLLAALAVLAALHPALVAARTAPRLWGRILLGWALALMIAAAPSAHVRVTPEGLAGAQLLLPAAVVMAVGLGTASTALSGWRRTMVPIAVGGIFSILGRAQAIPHLEASEVVQELRDDLLEAARERSWNGTLILLDAPAEVAGLDLFGPDLGALLSPVLPPGDRARGVAVRSMTRRAFEVASRGDSLSELRASGVSVLLPGSALERAETGRQSVALLSRGEELDRATWVGEGKSRPGMVFDPLRARHIQVTALPDADTSGPPVLRWASDLGDGGTEEIGVWVSGDGAPVAVFDLEDRPTWLLGGRVQSVWMTGGVVQITSARVSPSPSPLVGVTPLPVGKDWAFELGGQALPEPVTGELSWRLGLQHGETYTYTELAPDEQSPDQLRFRGVADRVAPGVTWSLDLRAGGVSLARASGVQPVPTEDL